MKPLADKVAIVTGASAPNGIGRAVALRLAEEGAAVVVTDQAGTFELNGVLYDRGECLRDVADEIWRLDGTALTLELDVSKPGQIAQCIAAITERYDRIDILVNNAATLAGADNFLDTTAAQWEDSFRVNLLGPMMLSQAVIPEMRAVGGGRIINIGSTGSLGAEAGFGAYTAMKHGLVGMTKTLAAEFGADNILCNTVCPGYIMTDMHMAANERLAQEKSLSVEAIQAWRYAGVALRNAGQPEDVAAAVAYLAGPQAAYITGVNLPVAGGVPFGI